MAVQYPHQIFDSWNQKKVFSGDFNYLAAEDADNMPPMEMHKGNLSRIALTINDMKSGVSEILTANIPAAHVPAIKNKTLRAQLMMDMQRYYGKETKSSPAYDVVIKLGQFSGQTPAQVLKHDINDKEALLNTRAFLEKNVDKYPANKEQIVAIDDAINLLDADQLEDSSEKGYLVYKAEYKPKSPIIDGKKTIYSIKIYCHFGANYPWEVEITNWLAPMGTSSGGRQVPQMSAEGVSASRKASSVNLTDEEWIKNIDMMYRRLNQFEYYEYPHAYKRMKDEEWKPDNK